MRLVYQANTFLYSVNLNNVSSYYVRDNSITESTFNTTYVTADNHNDAVKRFNDINEADAEGLSVYDCRKSVGYWKAKKPGPKPKPAAKEPANAQPEPKK